jgi:hypothetical protein
MAAGFLQRGTLIGDPWNGDANEPPSASRLRGKQLITESLNPNGKK